jgi:parallel beta-helix repeat protein
MAATIALVLAVLTSPATASSGTLTITSSTTLTEDHYGNIVIDADNVTLDCAGHTVFGPGDSGFSGGINVAGGRAGVIVRQCTVTGFNVNGIFAGGASDGRYEANVIYGNAAHGMHLDNGSNNVVVGNTSRSSGGIGIVLTRATQSRIEGNTVQGNTLWAGIALFDGSHDNLVANNTALRNGLGFVVEDATSNELRGNTANLNGGSGFLLIRGANNNLLESNTANGNGGGIQVMLGSNSNMVRNNVANGNAHDGFTIYMSDNNSLTGNTGNSNGSFGFLVFGGSSFNTLTGNVGRGNGLFDAFDEGSGTGNVWVNNNFGTAFGI